MESAPVTDAAPSLRLAREEPSAVEPPARMPEPASETKEPDAPTERSRSPMEEAVTPEEIEMLLRLFDEDRDAARGGGEGGGS